MYAAIELGHILITSKYLERRTSREQLLFFRQIFWTAKNGIIRLLTQKQTRLYGV